MKIIGAPNGCHVSDFYLWDSENIALDLVYLIMRPDAKLKLWKMQVISLQRIGENRFIRFKNIICKEHDSTEYPFISFVPLGANFSLSLLYKMFLHFFL